jgi:hypothetical protein
MALVEQPVLMQEMLVAILLSLLGEIYLQVAAEREETLTLVRALATPRDQLAELEHMLAGAVVMVPEELLRTVA